MVEDVLAETCAAKNAVVRKGGFSSHYLVLGYHPLTNKDLGDTHAIEEGAAPDFVRAHAAARLAEEQAGRAHSRSGPLHGDAVQVRSLFPH